MTTKPTLPKISALLIFTFVAMTASAQSVLNTYPTGAEGIRPGTTPPPGNYTKSYNLFYWADDFKDASGNSADPNFHAFSYLTAIRHFWITDLEIFGANYGMDMALPFVHNEIEFSTPNGVGRRTSTGLGDILFQPVLLGWHGENWDIGALYGIFFPTGDFDPLDPSSLGKGHWTHMVGLGGTWYPDAQKTWSISLANRIEFHTHNDDSDISPGAHYSMEWGVGKKLADLWEIGAVGTITQKIEDDSGSGVFYDPGIHDRVYSAGVEMTKFFPEAGISGSVRWFHEFGAEARTQGDAIWLSVTKVW